MALQPEDLHLLKTRLLTIILHLYVYYSHL